MRKASKPKKKTKKVIVRKKRKKVRPAKRELLKTGTYVRFVDVSDRTDMDQDLQRALIGAVCPVISPEDRKARAYAEEVKETFLDENGERGEYIGYLVERDELTQYLVYREFQDTAYFVETYQKEILWFPPECCAEVKKNQLN